MVSFATEEPAGPQDIPARELGTGTTDANGVASLTYTSNDAGIDNIYAYIDSNSSGYFDEGEPMSTVSSVKYWFLNFFIAVTPASMDRL